MHHLININDLHNEDIENIFSLIPAMQFGFVTPSGDPHTPKIDKTLATLFFEPSTRTKLSFQTAMYKLGGNVIDLPINSSQEKGESDLDTVRTISEYSDILVIRHPDNVMEDLASICKKPMISAGESYFSHPTQALIDFYTIRKYHGHKDEIKIMFTGDLCYSRTIPSLLQLLQREKHKYNITFANMTVPYLVDHDDPYINYINEYKIESKIEDIDVLYMTRPQKERWTTEVSKSNFILTKDLLHKMKPEAIILHPLPRNEELPREIDDNHRAVYFDQVKSGLYIRMALLRYMLFK